MDCLQCNDCVVTSWLLVCLVVSTNNYCVVLYVINCCKIDIHTYVGHYIDDCVKACLILQSTVV